MGLNEKFFKSASDTPFAPSDNFNTVLYTGTGSTNPITTVGFPPDFTWVKSRNNSRSHALVDSVRGGNGSAMQILDSATTASQFLGTNFFNSLDSAGFTVSGNNTYTNNGDFVAWNWKAGGAPTATNSAGAGNQPTADSVMIDGVSSTTALDGTLPAISISANTAAGFSIVTNKTSDSEHTVAHGLNAAPELILSKPVSNGVYQWNCWANGFSEYQGIELSTSNQRYTNGGFRTVYSTSTTTMGFGLQFLSATNYGANTDIVNYCFHSVSGYQKIGSYTGGGASNVTVNLGFSPRFVIIKRATGGSGNWTMYDNVRQTGSVPYDNYTILLADDAFKEQADNTIRGIQFTSTGIVLNKNYSLTNTSGSIYIYLAIA